MQEIREQKINYSNIDSESIKTDDSTNKKNITDGEWCIGDIIPQNFRILDIIKGGMGIIYIVESLGNRDKFAMKTLQNHFILNNILYEMFVKEAELWVNLEKHPNIVQAIMVSQINAKPFIFLEYVDGESLEEVIKKGRLPIKQAILYMIQICRAMAYAFNKLSIIHRDLKPSNCMLSSNGELKITDFGLAKVLSAVTSVMKTDPGYLHMPEEVKKSHATAFQGTLPYMAPELFLATHHAGLQTDIYSVGVILYEMLTGRKPVFGDNMADFMTQHTKNTITDVRQERSDTPPLLAEIAMKCLNSDPSKRFDGFDVIVSTLETLFMELYDELPYNPSDREEVFTFNDWFRRGTSLAYLNRHYEAVRCYDEVLKIKPNMTEVLNAKGDSFLSISFYSEALKCFNRAIAIEPDNIKAYIKKGNSYFQLKKFQDALTCYNTALELEPDNQEGLVAKGIYLSETGNPLKSLHFFEKALSFNPDSEITLFHNAKALMKLDKLELAVSLLDRACEINPRNSQSWLCQGKILMDLGKYSSAIQCLERAKELIPGSDEVWKNIEKCKIFMGNYSDAFDEILEKIKEYPEDKELKLLMYELYAELGDISGMIEICDDIIAMKDDDLYEFKFRRIELLDRALMFEEALKGLNELLKKSIDPKLKILHKQISGRHEFYNDWILSFAESAMTVPSGSPEMPIYPLEQGKKIEKIISRLKKQPSASLKKIANDFSKRGDNWTALKIILLDNEINGESSDNYLVMGELFFKLNFLRNSLFAYNMYIQTAENGWKAWRDISYIYAKMGLYTESLFFGFKAMTLMSEDDPILIMNLLIYAESSGMSHLLPVICLKALEKSKERSFANFFVTAIIYSILGRFSESERILVQYCDSSTDKIQYFSRLLMVKNELFRKNYRHAEKLFLKIKSKLRTDNSYYYYGGMVLKNIFHSSSSLEMLEKIHKNCPRAEMAIAFMKTTENDGIKNATERFKLLERRKETSAEAGVSLALLEYKQENYDKAHEKIMKVSLKFPLAARVQLLKIVLEMFATKKTPVEQFEKYLSHHVMEPSPFIILSSYYLKNQMYDKAEEIIEQGLSVHSWNSELLNNKAVFCLMKKDYNLADSVLEKAIFADRHNSYALNNQAVRAMEKGSLRKAFLIASKAQTSKKNSIDIIYTKLYIMFFKENYNGILREIDYGEEEHKNIFSFALFACLSGIFSQNDNYADFFADKLLEYSPENSATWMLSGYLLTQKNKDVEAISAYRNAILLDSQNAFSHIALGQLLTQKGFAEEGSKATKIGTEILELKNKSISADINMLKSFILKTISKPKYLISSYEPKFKKMYTLLPTETEIMKNILEQ